jgi:uncharacterized protein YbcV (DUF1398 family)
MKNSFTLDQIQASHQKVKTGADFPAFVQALVQMGVTGYDMYVADRHAEYFGKNQFSVKEDAKYPEFTVSGKGDNERFRNILRMHQMGKTNYMTFCEQLATAGIERWSLNVKKMTCTYFDIHGTVMLEEKVPMPSS